MKCSRTYAIVGTGAVGGYYGALLRKAGADVRFLLRSDFEHVKARGLKIDSPAGGFDLPEVSAFSRPRDMPPCDVAIVAWKTTQNASLASTLPFVLKPGGIVLVLQNGLDPERESAAAMPGAHVLGGLCFLCSRKAGPGWIQHQDYGTVTLAAYSPGPEARGETPEMRAVAKDLSAAGVEVRIHEDWRAARWRKLAWNIPFNGLCALLGADTARLLGHAPMRSQVEAIIDEVIAGADACGVPLPPSFRDRLMRDTEAMLPYEPSMKLDRDAGRPMELDAIYGRPLHAMAEAGFRAPLIQSLHAQLDFPQGREASRDR